MHGDVFYTQEQRGEDEMVSAYTVKRGQPVWRHSDRVRFWESNGGAGPRATPTLHNGRVYAFGATGILNALDARTGAVIWSHNVASDTKRDVPTWGFSSSPLVIDDLVIVAASGTLAAYEVDGGKLRWSRPSRGGSYTSPHRMTIAGVTQVVFLSAFGATGVAPTGAVLWEHPWPGGTPIAQPALTSDGDVLLAHADPGFSGVAPSGHGLLGRRRADTVRMESDRDGRGAAPRRCARLGQLLLIPPRAGRLWPRIPARRGAAWPGSRGGDQRRALAKPLWGRPTVLNSAIFLNGDSHIAVGIAPPSLLVPTGPVLHPSLAFAPRIDIWKPIAPKPRDLEGENWNYGLLVRLKPGESVERGRVQLQAMLNRSLRAIVPDLTTEFQTRLAPIREIYAGKIRLRLLLVAAAAGLLLLAAGSAQ